MFSYEPRLASLNAFTLHSGLYSLINSTDSVVNRSKQHTALKRKVTSLRFDSVTWNLHEAETEIYQ
jgi:hypothetical protein